MSGGSGSHQPTFEAIGAPELMTPGADYAFFPAVARDDLTFRRHARRRQSLVGRHRRRQRSRVRSASSSDAGRRGSSAISRCRRTGGRSRILRREHRPAASCMSGSWRAAPTRVDGEPAAIAGISRQSRPAGSRSPTGRRAGTAGAAAGVPHELADGETRLVRDDCGGRPRQWLDEQTLLVETFGAGLNAFITRRYAGRGAASAALVDQSTGCPIPRVSPDCRWLAFDATHPGGSPVVAIARFADGTTSQEEEWIAVDARPAIRSGRATAVCSTTCRRSRTWIFETGLLARRFDPSTGLVNGDLLNVLTLSEMIVPAMITAVAPIVAPDQIIFVLGDYRGDVWMREV